VPFNIARRLASPPIAPTYASAPQIPQITLLTYPRPPPSHPCRTAYLGRPIPPPYTAIPKLTRPFFQPPETSSNSAEEGGVKSSCATDSASLPYVASTQPPISGTRAGQGPGRGGHRPGEAGCEESGGPEGEGGRDEGIDATGPCGEARGLSRNVSCSKKKGELRSLRENFRESFEHQGAFTGNQGPQTGPGF
jgi:hypothetical protein